MPTPRRDASATRRPSLPEALRRELCDVVDAPHLIEDPDRLASYETDATRRFEGAAAAVVRPAGDGELAAVLGACSRTGVAVVPQGGNSGLVGGATPRAGDLVLSLERMRALGEVDGLTATVVAEAGVTLAELQRHAARSGLAFGVDFGAREVATVGGMIATDAGGSRVVRHGPMGAHVAGLAAVLADGSAIDRMRALDKEATGYPLEALMVGSEGTLGVVTRARLRLVPELPQRVAALVGLADVDAAVALVGRLRRELEGLEAADFFLPDGLELVCAHLRVRPPLEGRAGVYLLVECAGRTGVVERLAEALGESGDEAAVADDTASRSALWRLREAHTEAIAAAGVPRKLDVALPGPEIAGFVARAREIVAELARDARTIVYGHLAQGTLHVNLLGLDRNDERADVALLELVAQLGGAISAEHGIGQAKARWLHLARSPGDVAAMRSVKRALDPAGIMNPDKLLALDERP